MIFRATILLDGISATGIRVPPEVVFSLGTSKKPAVRVALGDFVYRTTVATMGGVFMIPVSADVRKGAGVAAGDEVEVGIELDTDPREIIVPPDLSEALAVDDAARRFFEGLSYSNKRRIVLSIDDAKTAETRQRRVAKSVDMLRAGRT